MKVQLIVVQGKPEGKVIPLNGPVFKIGRGETCHLRPTSELISREHAEFQVGADQVVVRDLGSRNGTLVNGKAIKAPCVLKDRDLVQVGQLTFAISIEGAAVASAKSAAPAKPVSPDDVSHDEIESWLVADANQAVPDRPSGIYGGDTITISAYQGDKNSPPAVPAAKENAPAAKESAPAAKPPAPPAAKPASPPAAKPVPPAAKPASPAPVAAAAKPMAPAKPAVPAPQPVPASPLGDELEFERLPEGEGDGETEDDLSMGGEDEDSSADGIPDEFIDESNPFYAKKKEPESPVKPAFKDTSDAANEILRKMLERRRSSRA